MKLHRNVRRAAFWVGVAAVSVLANAGISLGAAKYPNSGFANFTKFTHYGGSN